MWQQNYTPVASSLPLSALVAAIPIFALLILLGVMRQARLDGLVDGAGRGRGGGGGGLRHAFREAVRAATYGAAFGLCHRLCGLRRILLYR